MDPDKGGDLLWTYQAGKGSGIGGVWGATVDGQQAYFAVADQRTPAPGGTTTVRMPRRSASVPTCMGAAPPNAYRS